MLIVNKLKEIFMAKIDYNSWQEYSNKQDYNNQINFFQIKNDGESAIVRFVEDEPEKYDIIALHTIQEGTKFKKISCLRQPYEPIANCPLCESDNKVLNRVFVKLIQYVEENGKITPKFCIWERPAQFVKTLGSYRQEYGELLNNVFKIVRHGSGKSTTYEILYLPPQRYPENEYPSDASVFNGYTALGKIVKEIKYKAMYEMVNGSEATEPTNEPIVPKQQTDFDKPFVPEQPMHKQEAIQPNEDVVQQRKPWEVPTSSNVQNNDIPTQPRRPRFY